jgi:hypothetical protein
MKTVRFNTPGMITVAALILTPLATGQADNLPNQPDTGIQLAQLDPQSTVSEGRLDQFVNAFVEVQLIRDQVASQLQQIETEAQAQELRQQAQDQMVTAVEAEGIGVQEYNDIAVKMQQDPELFERVQEMAAKRM